MDDLPTTLARPDPVWGPADRLLDGAEIPGNGFLDAYRESFARPDELFLSHHALGADKRYRVREFSRGQFWSLACRAANAIRRQCRPGDTLALCFGGNLWQDLAFRLGATITGATPVTVNWQADDLERVCYKIELTGAKMILTHHGFDAPLLAALRERFDPEMFYDADRLEDEAELPAADFAAPDQTAAQATKIIIFTSGTTGKPKGVALSYRSYAVNRATFESFLGIAPDQRLAAVLANPLHHTNSTAISDWMLRRPGAQLHLVERYSTQYWRLLTDVARADHDYVVAPLVSRHFDFLADLNRMDRLPLPAAELRAGLGRVNFLLGSAPVGPMTVQRVGDFAGGLPVVRFGSTETCLQVIGIPQQLSAAAQRRAFERGWSHRWQGEAMCAYYLGQDHFPHTEAAVVRSIDSAHADYLAPCEAGEPGHLVTRGGNIMSDYVGDPERTAEVLRDGWYLGLGDICFWLGNKDNGRPDYYWFNRDSAILMRGGANYSYDQINEELAAAAASAYGLKPDEFSLAVVGLRHDSEHDDSCCVTIDLKAADSELQERLLATFVAEVGQRVSKGAKPDYVRLGAIPRNFKGAVLLPQLKAEFFDAETE